MSKPRKTVEIAKLKEQVNNYLASDYKIITRENREGAYLVLESALHAAHAYRGWGLLTYPKIGQIFVNGKWVIKDQTRRFYY